MKKNLKLFLLVGLVASVGFTSCTEEETVTPTPTTDTSAVLTEASAAGTVWNLLGPNMGAFDLKNGVEVSSTGSSTIKDLLDQSYIDSTGVKYPKTLGTANGSLFVKAATGFDYTAITENKAKAAFDAGTSSALTGELAAGDIYIVKNARFTHNYVVVKVLSVTVTANDNLDKVTFNYKK